MTEKSQGTSPAPSKDFHPSILPTPRINLPCPHIDWKKALYHAHVQCFAKTARTRNQRDCIPGLPPFSYKCCLVYIKITILPQCSEILRTYRNCPCHSTPPCDSLYDLCYHIHGKPASWNWGLDTFNLDYKPEDDRHHFFQMWYCRLSFLTMCQKARDADVLLK